MWSGAWPSLAISNFDTALTGAEILVVSPPSGQPDEVTRALTRYLVVRTCGFLETVVDECCIAFIGSKSSPAVAAYGASWLGRGANPTPGRLVGLVGRFDGAWATELQSLFDADDERLKREVAFLVDRRNKIAHGQGEGISGRRALDLAASAREVTDWFIRRLDPR